MNYYVLSIGNMKKFHENEIVKNYQKRLKNKLFIKEYVSNYPSGDVKKKDESKKLLSMVPLKSKIILLDQKGENYSSEELANILSKWRNEGFNKVSFIIGGADGVTEEVFNNTDKIISFGRMTWPHIMSRLMLIEQIYRSETIEIGHPYHRN